jgi:hypothetical protein
MQATPQRPVALERRVILDAEYENPFFGMHLKTGTELKKWRKGCKELDFAL